jgi:hypothetical protein
MPAGSRHVLLAAAVVLIVALAAPAAAFADKGGKCTASACKVYSEQSAPTAGHHQPPRKAPTASNKSGGSQQQQQQPKNLSRVLAHAGNDRLPLSRLLNGDTAIGSLESGAGGGSPGLLGAAFDLGAGPTVLLAILLATALGLAGRGRVHGWLRRRSSS